MDKLKALDPTKGKGAAHYGNCSGFHSKTLLAQCYTSAVVFPENALLFIGESTFWTGEENYLVTE